MCQKAKVVETRVADLGLARKEEEARQPVAGRMKGGGAGSPSMWQVRDANISHD